MSPEKLGSTTDLLLPQVRRWTADAIETPVVIGLCGAQGSGKSTVSAGLAAHLEREGHSVAILSLDDLYLTREERISLGAFHPLLTTRGVPGTHDVALGLRTLDACAENRPTLLPRFDKAYDTRAPQAIWPRIEAPVDIILFEGWCVGAVPQDAAALVDPINELERKEDQDGFWRRFSNIRLADDYRRLFDRIDYLVLLAAPSFECVAAWRKEQEHKLRATLTESGQALATTLDDCGIERFIQFYQRLTQHILSEMPGRADLTVQLNADRQPVGYRENIA